MPTPITAPGAPSPLAAMFRSLWDGALVPTGDVRSQTFEAPIDLPAVARNSWTVGQLVSVAVPIRARASSIAVPRDALVLRHNGSFLFRINQENIEERIAVEIGDWAGGLVAVIGPINAGDRVAIRGAENLQEGAEVKIMISQGPASTVVTEGWVHPTHRIEQARESISRVERGRESSLGREATIRGFSR